MEKELDWEVKKGRIAEKGSSGIFEIKDLNLTLVAASPRREISEDFFTRTVNQMADCFASADTEEYQRFWFRVWIFLRVTIQESLQKEGRLLISA
jgi:hypothetical protein